MKNYALLSIAIMGCAGCGVGVIDDGLSNSTGNTIDSGTTSLRTFFRPTIQSDLNAAGCLGGSCHGGGAMPMQLSPQPSGDTEWQANYQEVVSRTNVLLAKSIGDGGHPASLTTGDEILLRWQDWIDAGSPFEESVVAPDAGPLPDAPAGGLTWNSTIGQLFVDDGCTGCHNAQGAQGAYSLESYGGALGFGTDQSVPNVVPGDATSLLITYYDDLHRTSSTENAALVRQWIVDENAEE